MNRHEPLLRIAKRNSITRLQAWAVRLIAVVLSLIVCALLSFQLSITSPRVSGGIFASYTIILTQLGMPAEVVGLVMAANFLWGNTCCGLGMLVKCLDVLDLACREGAIKEPKVKAKA